MRVTFKGQVPKDSDYPDAIEDAVDFDPGRSTTLALCDGASESFDSQTWARLLARRFVGNPRFDDIWLAEAVCEYEASCEFESLSWAAQAAYLRGSFTTLVGIHQAATHTLEVTSIGDSLAVLLDGEEFVASYRYKDSTEFLERPWLLSTRAQYNSVPMEKRWAESCTTWDLTSLSTPTVLCMSDAIACWALSQHEKGRPVWQALSEISSVQAFSDLVEEARRTGTMRVDDTSLIIAELGQVENDGLTIA